MKTEFKKCPMCKGTGVYRGILRGWFFDWLHKSFGWRFHIKIECPECKGIQIILPQIYKCDACGKLFAFYSSPSAQSGLCQNCYQKEQMKVIKPGTVLELLDGLPIQIISLRLFSDESVSYEVGWWDGNTYHTEWMREQQLRIKTTPDLKISFKKDASDSLQ